MFYGGKQPIDVKVNLFVIWVLLSLMIFHAISYLHKILFHTNFQICFVPMGANSLSYNHFVE